MTIVSKGDVGRKSKVREDHFPDDYRLQVFKIWFSHNKPTGDVLHELIPEQEELKAKPTIRTLRWWVNSHYVPLAAEMDETLLEDVRIELIDSKKLMLARHAYIGESMIDMALSFFQEHPIENEKTALSMLVKGVEIERESRGFTTMDRIESLSNEKILKEIEAIVIKTSQLTDAILDE